MATINIKKAPSIVPGFGATPIVRDGVRTAKATIASSDYGSSPLTLFTVPANTVVFGAALNLSGAWASSDATALNIEVGDSDLNHRFIGVGNAYTASTSAWITSFQGYEYTEVRDILCTITGTPDAGSAVTADIWLFFRTDSDKQQ